MLPRAVKGAEAERAKRRYVRCPAAPQSSLYGCSSMRQRAMAYPRGAGTRITNVIQGTSVGGAEPVGDELARQAGVYVCVCVNCSGVWWATCVCVCVVCCKCGTTSAGGVTAAVWQRQACSACARAAARQRAARGVQWGSGAKWQYARVARARSCEGRHRGRRKRVQGEGVVVEREQGTAWGHPRGRVGIGTSAW